MSDQSNHTRLPNPSKSMRVLFALPTLGQPRHAKRVAMLQETGFQVEVTAFERRYHKGRMPDCPIESLGVIEHGNYRSRLIKLARAIIPLRQAIRRNDCVYAFGPDMALACLLAKLFLRRPAVMEIGDLRYMQVADGLKGRIARWIDLLIANRCKLIAVTSSPFYENYYKKSISTKTPGFVVENKLEASFCNEMEAELATNISQPDPSIRKAPLRIGYFGFLRNRWSLDVLHRLSEKYPERFKVVIAGHPTEEIHALLKPMLDDGKIEFLGEYRSPTDLPGLFASVDMIWSVYQPLRKDDWGYYWARPNRFYQSCLFRKPYFSRAGCIDSTIIEEQGIGKTISKDDIEEAVEEIASISSDEVAAWTSNMAALPRETYCYTDEAERLGELIKNIISDSKPI